MNRCSKTGRALTLAAFLALCGTQVLAMGTPAAEDAAEKYKDAVAAVEKKDYRGAISLLKDVIEQDSRNADALNYLGFSYRKLGDFNQALSFYKRALDVSPDHKGANEYIGQAYLGLNQPALADSHLARLERICGKECNEYRELKTAIDSFKATGKLPQSSANW